MKTISVIVNDGIMDSNKETAAFSIVHVNDETPTITVGPSGNTEYTNVFTEESSVGVPIVDILGISIVDSDVGPSGVKSVRVYVDVQDDGEEMLQLNGSHSDKVTIAQVSASEILISEVSLDESTSGEYEHVLRQITYKNIADEPSAPLERVVTFVVCDADFCNSGEHTTININLVNDSPVIHSLPTQVTYQEGQIDFIVSSVFWINDTDSTQLAKASIKLVEVFEAPGDEYVTLTGATSGLDVNSNGTYITIEGLSSISDYQQLLRSAGYVNTVHSPGKPELDQREIEFYIEDAAGGSFVTSVLVSTSSWFWSYIAFTLWGL